MKTRNDRESGMAAVGSRVVAMKTVDFLESLADLVRQQLPPELKEFQVIGPSMSILKLHYGRPTVHYEVWIQRRRMEVEVGLHFEGDSESNLRYLELLDQHLDTVRSGLGPNIRVERWDKGWTRAHESVPWEPLSDDFLIEMSFKLSGSQTRWAACWASKGGIFSESTTAS